MCEGFVSQITNRNATAVYIDGYNLYYGRIRGTPYKWLDVVSLFEHLLHGQNPHAELNSVRYFSAPALGRFATHGDASVLAQQDYIRALQQVHRDRFSTVMGKHSYDRHGTSLPHFEPGRPFDRTHRVKVWKLEEKQTDVNLALSLYREASTGRYHQVVGSRYANPRIGRTDTYLETATARLTEAKPHPPPSTPAPAPADVPR
ncbi:hypothetical protein GCM10007235_12420 [Pseudoxanthomonas indica]|nr:hypothetical protein GCM10007235_12420 [Pseudoxanthomonas indica]